MLEDIEELNEVHKYLLFDPQSLENNMFIDINIAIPKPQPIKNSIFNIHPINIIDTPDVFPIIISFLSIFKTTPLLLLWLSLG